MAHLYEVPYSVSKDDVDLTIADVHKERDNSAAAEPGFGGKQESGYMKISTVIVLFVVMCAVVAVLVVGTGLIVFFLASDNTSSDKASGSGRDGIAGATAEVRSRPPLTTSTQTPRTSTPSTTSITTSHVESRCPDRWIRFGESCYLFSNVGQIFINAKYFCEGLDSYLVHVNSLSENLFLRSVARDFKAANHWIGLSDELVEGIWKWTDTGKTGDFLGFSPGEPTHGREENCAALYHQFDYAWVDITCTVACRPICEKHYKH